ncbi:MAG TPA: spermidine synthase [Thermoanaerobaculia bacterium]|jgi:spermidine synthase
MSGAAPSPTGWLVEAPSQFEFAARAIAHVFIHKHTAFQELYIVATHNLGKALVLDGKWQSCVADEFIYHEALVQPALMLHGAARRVLILGGAEGATAREAARWPTVQDITMVDIDREVVDACRDFLPEMHRDVFADPRLHVVIEDASSFLDGGTTHWDIIIMDLCDPVADGPSLSLFTVEAFSRMAYRLASRGIVAVQAGPITGAGFSTVVRTMRQVFPTVLPYSAHIPTYPGTWGFVVGSRDEYRLPAEREIGRKLRAVISDLRYLDAAALKAMFALPRYVQRTLIDSDAISTKARPVTFF